MLVAAVFLCAALAQSGPARQNKVAPSAPSKTATGAADVAAGKNVYAAQCDACHYPHSAAKKVGPGMKGIYRKAKFADGRAVSDANMISWIRNGGKNMPPLATNLNAEELREVIAYLHTL